MSNISADPPERRVHGIPIPFNVGLVKVDYQQWYCRIQCSNELAGGAASSSGTQQCLSIQMFFLFFQMRRRETAPPQNIFLGLSCSGPGPCTCFLQVFRFCSLLAGIVPKSTFCTGKVKGPWRLPKSILGLSCSARARVFFADCLSLPQNSNVLQP